MTNRTRKPGQWRPISEAEFFIVSPRLWHGGGPAIYETGLLKLTDGAAIWHGRLRKIGDEIQHGIGRPTHFYCVTVAPRHPQGPGQGVLLH